MSVGTANTGVQVRPPPPEGRRFQPGYDPRRRGPISAAERAFRDALESEHIPQASALLTKVFDAGMAGDAKMAELFFKVCGLIKKPSDDEAIRRLATELLDGMIAEAKARKQASPAGGVIDVPETRGR